MWLRPVHDRGRRRPTGPSHSARILASRTPTRAAARAPGFTLIELILVIVLVGILATIALGQFRKVRVQAQNARAIAEVRTLSTEIDQYDTLNGYLPVTLADIGRGGLLDPWGNPYEYLSFAAATMGKGNGGGGIAGVARKDKNLVPLNSTYDLYSKGEDGLTQKSLTPNVSHDDIIRANDGTFIGLAVNY